RQAARRAEAARNEPVNLLTDGNSTDDYGYSVVLTLDEYIQYTAEKELAAACQEWNSPRGTVIVLASKTAEILALASYPTYDLNNYAHENEEAKRNLGVWFAYEPGSIFKIVASSAVLNEGIMTSESTVFCENGRYRLSNGRIIRDVSGKGWLTLEQVLHKSSNIGMIKVVKQLGHEDFSTYIERYGFGKMTGVDLPYEHSGSLDAVKRWDTHSLGAVPFGQGVMVTPLQMVSALNVIANGGTLLRPYITREIRDNSGKLVEKKYPIEVRQVIRPMVAKQMTDILVGVVEGGSGRRARVEGYHVAGKTGTAQKAEKNGKGYLGKEIMSFMGFLPAENPMVSIIVMLDEPTGARFSGQIAGPLFQKVAAQTMQYLKQTEFFGPELQKTPKYTPAITKQTPTQRFTVKGEGL
ncbi:MAG: penicillin-binding protein 2, partial [Candidatus Poribacteria bacterium]|nr:penicillin-binding protein 2 [Candidatus Poribacteria bacterium]